MFASMIKVVSSAIKKICSRINLTTFSEQTNIGRIMVNVTRLRHLHKLFLWQKSRNTLFEGVQDFDIQPH